MNPRTKEVVLFALEVYGYTFRGVKCILKLQLRMRGSWLTIKCRVCKALNTLTAASPHIWVTVKFPLRSRNLDMADELNFKFLRQERM